MQDRIEHSSPNVTAEQAKSILEVIGAPSDREHVEWARLLLGVGRRALVRVRTTLPPRKSSLNDFPDRLTRVQVLRCLAVMGEPDDKHTVDVLGGMISRLLDQRAA